MAGIVVYASLWSNAGRQAFVLAIAKNEPLMFGGPGFHAAEAIVAGAAPADRWKRHSAGKGSKGLCLYDWSLTELWRLQMYGEAVHQLTSEERQWGHYLLVRRSIEKPKELAYYVVFCRREVASLETLAAAAGTRWQIESGFEAAKGECGLDEYEVRKWPAWYRHITLSLLAHAFLVVMRAKEGGSQGDGQKGAMDATPAFA